MIMIHQKNIMARMVRSCIKSLLKLVNSLIGIAGIAIILYSVWMIRVWERQISDFPAFSQTTPWFIYTILGVGSSLCVITCFGHIAAETANGCCLYLYMFLVFMLLALEAAVTVDVFLNRNWEKDFPNDATGNLDNVKQFITSDFKTCKWIGLSVVSIQGLCFILGMVLKAIGPHKCYDSDDEFAPLLNNPSYASKNDAWNIKIDEKVK